MTTQDHMTDGPGQAFESVWDAIEDTPAEAANMRMRSELMIALKTRIKAQGWMQAEAARVMGVPQPCISDLVRGKIGLFSLDALGGMASAAGLHLEVRVCKAA